LVTNSAVAIQIELGEPLRSLTADSEVKGAAADLAYDLTALLENLGLDGTATVTVAAVDSQRAVRVRVHGALQPYPESVLRRAWHAVAPPELVDLPRDASVAGRFPDAWTAALASEDGDGTGLVPLAAAFIRRLAFEVVNERPECLVGLGQVESLAARLTKSGDDSGVDVETDLLADVVAELLELGVVAPGRREFIDSLLLSARVGRSLDETVEAAFSRLRPGVLELHIAPEYLAALTGEATLGERIRVYDERFNGFQERFANLEASIAQLGLRLPDLVWTPSTDVPDRSIAVKVNDRLGPSIPLLAPHHLLVNDSMDRLSSHGVKGESIANPLNGRDNTLVDESARKQIDDLGLWCWTAPEFLILAIYVELSRLTNRLLGVEDVTYQLAKLELACPELLHDVIGRFSIGDITRVLRGLLEERLPIRNLPAILERLVQIDLAGEEQRVLVGHHVAVRAEAAQSTTGWRTYLAFVRSGLKHIIFREYGQGQSVLVGYRLPAAVEMRAAGMTNGGVGSNGARSRAFQDDEREALADKVWSARSDERLRPVVVALPEARSSLRVLLGAELPDVAILGTNEIRAGIQFYDVNKEGERMAARTALVTDRVGQMLANFVGPPLQVDRDGDFTFPYESARVFVRVSVYGETSTIVIIFAITNREIPSSPELFKWVAIHSSDRIFGHLVAVEEADGVSVQCRHALLGDFLDRDELAAAVGGVATMADDIDDQIKELFGGKLFAEQ
jgi:hypothetical protein